ncbi:hypothetical protein GIS00_24310 [Nakamurella sp. YIM 132087]|uniref:DUF2142 domain-containing protein n=1 Tax=Nakamurella alba TaxID=2665158 RepID=A0A7K1FW82_9ACTN|nr:hypothetical protein [Nakamurella alba]MTD17064.1 hypothetical protein [Nakamurella alba]
MPGSSRVGSGTAAPTGTVRASLSRRDQRSRRLLRTGLVAAMIAGFVLSLLTLMAVNPFRPADENAHVGYVQSLVEDGRFPEVGEQVLHRFDAQPLKGVQHTANHPPLFYLLQAPIWWVGDQLDDPLAAFYAGRVLSALVGALCVLLVGLIAFGLTGRRRPEVGIGAALYLATFAPFVTVSGFFQNDSVGTATAALALLGLVGLALRPDRPRWPLVLVVAGCVLAPLARAQNVGVVAVCCLGVLLFPLLRAETRTRAAVLRSVLTVLVIGAGCAVTSGIFYLRNLNLYGDATGGAAVTALVRLKPRGESVLDDLLEPGTWYTLFINQPVWVGVWQGPRPGGRLWVSMACLGVIAVGILSWLAREFVMRRRAQLPGPRTAGRTLMAVRFLAAGLVLLHAVEAAIHVAGGGNLHGRYMFGAIAAVATVAAVGLLALPLGRRGPFLAVVVAVDALVAVTYIGFLATSRTAVLPGPDVGWVRRILDGLRNNGVPFAVPLFWILMTVLVAAIGSALLAIWRITGMRHPATPAGATGPADTPTVAQDSLGSARAAVSPSAGT